jgi:hypothetical protein
VAGADGRIDSEVIERLPGGADFMRGCRPVVNSCYVLYVKEGKPTYQYNWFS